jgi:hypothetical protein
MGLAQAFNTSSLDNFVCIRSSDSPAFPSGGHYAGKLKIANAENRFLFESKQLHISAGDREAMEYKQFP